MIERKLMVFDLDETLVHCVTENIEKADKVITINLSDREKVTAGVNIRPHVINCLKELAEYYELIVFTASHPNYANTVIDLLDPDQTIFSQRLFRSSCIRTDINLFVKDLRVLSCDLNSTVIVDNSIFSFASQLDNGVPIIPFYDDKDDRIMPKIKDYLISLKDMSDVRIINRKTFSLTELYELDISSFLKYYRDYPEPAEDSPMMEETEEDFKMGLTKTKSYSFAQSVEESDSTPKIGRRAMAMVNDQLEKLQSSLNDYLKNQGKGETVSKKTEDGKGKQ